MADAVVVGRCGEIPQRVCRLCAVCVLCAGSGAPVVVPGGLVFGSLSDFAKPVRATAEL